MQSEGKRQRCVDNVTPSSTKFNAATVPSLSLFSKASLIENPEISSSRTAIVEPDEDTSKTVSKESFSLRRATIDQYGCSSRFSPASVIENSENLSSNKLDVSCNLKNEHAIPTLGNFSKCEGADKLLNHWLFCDDPVTPRTPLHSFKRVPQNPSASTGSSFKLASENNCTTTSSETDVHQNGFATVKGFAPASITSNCYSKDDSLKTTCGQFGKASTLGQFIKPTAITPNVRNIDDAWKIYSKVVDNDSSKQTPIALAKLWSIYGNPLNTRASTADDFVFIRFPKDSESPITCCGLKDIGKMFYSIASQRVSKRKEIDRFGSEWICIKYRLFSSVACRKYTRELVKAIKNGTSIELALEEQPLPDPLLVLKRMLRCFWKEYQSNSEPTLATIVQGDAPPNSQVVVLVEDIKDSVLYLSDTNHLFNGIADNHVMALVEKNKITIGSKICLHGVYVIRVFGEEVDLGLSYNAISPAKGKKLGIQLRHCCTNIRELIGGAGNASMLDLIILKVLPVEFSIFFKNHNVVCLSEYEIRRLDGDENFFGLFDDIENVCPNCTFFVIDSKAALSIKDTCDDVKKLSKYLCDSSALLTIRNVNGESLMVLTPGTRFVISQIKVNKAPRFLESSVEESERIWLFGTNASNIKIREPVDFKDKVDRLWTKSTSKIHSLLFSKPALSLELDDAVLLKEDNYDGFFSEMDTPFVGQFCSLDVLVLHVGDITESKYGRYFRCFVVTSGMMLASINVTARFAHVTDVHGNNVDISFSLDKARLALQMLALNLCENVDKVGAPIDHLFFNLGNVEYVGYYKDANVYNFHLVSTRFCLSPRKFVSKLETLVHNNKLITRSNTRKMALETLQMPSVENICRKFARIIVNLRMQALELINCSDPISAKFAATLA
ncbi:Nucleic acid-binding [Babesia duncani]|uniref:Nucleic acid-binding n=1 Tax=Babesia duncani TaxID=323732 RepID=A0AAD9PLX6_9APIC|nr:Nucleic acid-binding [Babesia duncani]